MSKLEWDAPGKHLYETGVDRGVLYVKGLSGYNAGKAWNGLTTVTESPSGAEVTAIYADNIKYLNLMSAEDFGATIEAYTYPDEFAECDGSASPVVGMSIGQQPRKQFAFSYRTKIGNDETSELGYKLHIIYNCLASPSERAYATVNDSPEAISMSWEVSTTPVDVANFKPTAHLELDSTKVDADLMKEIEDALYGTSSAEPRLLTPNEIIDILSSGAGEPLTAPSIALDDSTLTITNVTNATKYKIYNGKEKVATVPAGETSTSFDLSIVLADPGTYSVTVKASASGYKDSVASTAVEYVVPVVNG